MQIQLVSSHGMLAILEVLEWYQTSQTFSYSASTSSPNPSPRMKSDMSLPGSGSARKTSGLGVVSSLGLGSLASLGSLALGSSGNGRSRA